MQQDEQAIRSLVKKWLDASRAADTATVLSLMADDVVFMVPGQEPFGKAAFGANAERMKNVKIEGTSNIEELKVLGDLGLDAQSAQGDNHSSRRKSDDTRGLHLDNSTQNARARLGDRSRRQSTHAGRELISGSAVGLLDWDGSLAFLRSHSASQNAQAATAPVTSTAGQTNHRSIGSRAGLPRLRTPERTSLLPGNCFVSIALPLLLTIWEMPELATLKTGIRYSAARIGPIRACRRC
jgi:uncharacterized protein (TIGR02246 family)